MPLWPLLKPIVQSFPRSGLGSSRTRHSFSNEKVVSPTRYRYRQIIRFPIDAEQLGYTHDRRAMLELELARKHRLSVHDAAYLALAISTSHRLATLDLRLADAARAEGVSCDPSAR